MSTGVWCAEFELSGDGQPGAVVPYAGQRVSRLLVRLHGEPIGYLTVEDADPAGPPARLADLAWAEFAGPIRTHLRAEGVTPEQVPVGTRPAAGTDRCPDRPVAGPPVSVIVCTRDRAAMLTACLDRLTAVTYPAVEFIVVDNAPSDDSTRAVVQGFAARDPRFRYEREDRAGLSWARNRGLAAATGTYVAYTDDDVSVDPHWVHGMVKGFGRRPDVWCVTGLVGTAAITNEAEAYFDARTSSWSTRCAPQLFDLSRRSAGDVLYPYSAGIFGTGASFGFHRQHLRDLGGFDEALGAGTATRGGEDLDVFVRVLLAGGAIAYEPSALVWHHHRADAASLSRQMYGYGAGLTAYLTKLLMQPSTRRAVLGRVPAGLLRIGRIRRSTTDRLGAPALRSAGPGSHRLLGREFAGYLAGPVLYARSRRDLKAAR